jgi:hypothetical protein
MFATSIIEEDETRTILYAFSKNLAVFEIINHMREKWPKLLR